MNLTRVSLGNPAAVLVVALLLVVIGLVTLFKLPIQLLPPIDEPEIGIWTSWDGAAPADMEAVIIEQQERLLRTIPGLKQISSSINQGNGALNLRFGIGTDMQRVMLDVINRLQQVPPLPRDAVGPIVNLGGWDSSGSNAASLLVRTLNPADARDPAEFHPVIKREVEPRMARIPGVAQVQLQTHRPREVRIGLDATRAAALGIALGDVVAAVRGASDVSGGFADVGRRQYTVRYLGQAPVTQLDQLIIAYRQNRPIRLADVAQVELARQDASGFTLRNGFPAYYLTLSRETGSNTVEILDSVNREIAALNAGPLASEGLAVELSYDASVHIRRAVELVQGNLVLGGILATLVLFFFLRSWRSTLLVGLTIPLCLFAAFIALQLFGRSLNVISLAGLAFAVGLVLDAAIIALENIVRLRQRGVALAEAVHDGAVEVAPALFASTATSVAIFLPILFIAGPEGQLFSDLALTLSIAVVVSLVSALSLLPVAARWGLTEQSANDRLAPLWEALTERVLRATDSARWRLGHVLVLTVGAGALAISLLPSADYLPRAHSDFIWANFSLPPGASQQALRRDLGEVVVQRMQPYLSGDKQPQIAYYNLSSWNSTWTGMAIYPAEPSRAQELIALLRSEVLADLPDTQAYVTQGSLLNFSGGGGREINVDIHGPELVRLLDAAKAGMERLAQVLPGVPVRPQPDLELAEPELLVSPDDVRIAQSGLSRAAVGEAVRAYTDGLYVGEYFDGDERMNVLLRSAVPWDNPEDLAAMPIATPLGGVQRLGELAQFNRTVGPSELRRIDGERTVSLQVYPPDELTLEDAIAKIRSEVQPAIDAVLLGSGGVRYRGSADGLEEALATMGLNLFYALMILLLLLTAMFRSLRDALFVLSVMPLACAGGVAALWLLNQVVYQSMDLLTMSGFVILLGLVVNNAILLVDRTRAAEREGLDRRAAVRSAVRERARPIYMSTLTSIFGMLPLMLVPGTGAEIYRGLATIIVGGMTVCALLTLLLLPSLLRWGESADGRGRLVVPPATVASETGHA